LTASALAQYIGSTVPGLSWSLGEGGNVFEEQTPPEPDIIVGVYSVGGGEVLTHEPFREPNVQLIVRGNEDPQSALNLWHLLYNYLHGLRLVQLPDNVWLVSCVVVQSAPIRIGPDENGRYRFSMNLRMETR